MGLAKDDYTAPSETPQRRLQEKDGGKLMQ
jgi:hypothetical protein